MLRKSLMLALFVPAMLLIADAVVTPASAAEDKVASGAIANIDTDNSSFVLKVSEELATTYTYNDETKWTLNGIDSTRDAVLKDGAKATVTANDEGVALMVAVASE